MEDEKNIQVVLTIEEVNLIIEALGGEPFKKVYKLIEKLHVQAHAQLKQKAKSAINQNDSPYNPEG